MKKITISITMLLMILTLMAETLIVGNDTEGFIKSRFNGLSSGSFDIEINRINVLSEGDFDIIEIEGFALNALDEGHPALPVMVKRIALPDYGDPVMKVEIVEQRVLEGNYYIKPLQGPLYDIPGYERPFIMDDDIYSSDGFYPDEMLILSDPAIIRDMRFVKLYFCPVQYNPVNGTVSIITKARITYSVDGAKHTGDIPVSNVLTEEFTPLYEEMFDNYSEVLSYKPVQTKMDRENGWIDQKAADFSGEGDYVIAVGGSDLYEASKDFAAYKSKLGYKVSIMHLANYSSSEQIRNAVRDAYNTWTIKPVYVLIIGDADSTLDPASNFIMRPKWSDFRTLYSYGVKGGFVPNDHWISLMDDNDYYSDVYVSRFNVKNLTLFDNMVNKTIAYETNPDMSETDWFTHYVGLGAEEDGRIFDRTAAYFWYNLQSYGWTHCDSMFERSYSGDIHQGIVDSIDDGQNIILFRGHGAEGWDGDGDDGRGFEFMGGANASYPLFYSNEDIDGRNNGTQGGFIFAPTCLAGNYAYPQSVRDSSSMADYWTQQSSRGGAGYFGATNVSLSYYNDSMSLGISHAITGAVSKRAFGPISVYGKNYMETYESGSQAYFELEMYLMNTLGDPALVMYTKAPQNLYASHGSQVYTGADTVTITVSDGSKAAVSGALVTLYDTLESPNFQMSALTDASGNAVFPTSLSVAGNNAMFITATKQDYVPYMTSVNVEAAIAKCEAAIAFNADYRSISIIIDNQGFDRFNIKRDGKLIAMTEGSYTDDMLEPGITYSYSIIGIANNENQLIGEYRVSTKKYEPKAYYSNGMLSIHDVNEFALMDIMGRIVFKHTFNSTSSGKFTIENMLPNGIYFVVSNNSIISKISILK